MKRAFLYGMMLAVAATSCTDENLDPNLNDGYLKIACPVNNISRALIEDTYLPEGSNIGVSVYDESNSSYNGVKYNNAKYTSSGTDNSQTWSTDDPLRLFSAEGTVYSYYPYSESVTDITEIPVEVATKSDYMYATPTTVNSTSPTAQLVMNHAMSAIKINLKKGGFTGEGNITNVSLTYGGWSTKGTLNCMTGEIIPDLTKKGYLIVLGTEGLLSQSGVSYYSTLVPTETEDNFRISIEVDGEIFNVYNKQIFEQGKLYTYDIIINKAEMTVSRCTVTEWEQISSPEQNISEGITINDEWYQEYISNEGIATSFVLEYSDILYAYIDEVKVFPVNERISIPSGTRNLKVVNVSPISNLSINSYNRFDRSIDNFHTKINGLTSHYICSEMPNLESIDCGYLVLSTNDTQIKYPKLKTIRCTTAGYYFIKSHNINYLDISSLTTNFNYLCDPDGSAEVTGTVKLPKVYLSCFDNLFEKFTGTGTLYLPEGATGYDEKIAALPEGWTVEYYSPEE